MREVIGPLGAGDEEVASQLLDAELGGRRQVRLGEEHDVLALGGVGAWVEGQLLGVACFSVDDERAELAALAVARRWRGQGIGSRLVEAVAAAAAAHSARVLWLVTTNDNLDALRLYQRRGFRLVQLRPGAVEEARKLKPSIPPVGEYGIPVRDELILERALDHPATPASQPGTEGSYDR